MRCTTFALLAVLTLPSAALAALGLILPSDDIASQGESPQLGLQVRLFEPAGRRFLELGRPQRFGVQHLGDQTELLTALKSGQEPPATAWRGEFTIRRPGDHTFYAEFAPRWDTASDQFVVTHAKLCVNALGLEEGWDEPVGLDAEIVPLSRPYGLWTGNLFSGQVLLDGEPAPYAAIEVVWLGDAPHIPAALAVAADAYRIQKIRADANGVFHSAMPRSGWWGFGAVLDADWTIPRDGEEKPVTIMTSYWVLARDMP